jgi:urease accessory protein
MMIERAKQATGRWWKNAGIALAAFSILIVAEPANAHSESSVAAGFVTGFSHPIYGLDHLLAMVAVGLWGAVLGRPLVYILPIVFPSIMAGGAILGMSGLELPPVELGIALSVLLLGLLIAAKKSLPIWAATTIVGFFAIFHGFAHGKELPITADPVGYSAGFVLATGLLHLLGIGLGALIKLPGRYAVIPQALGALIALAGSYFLYQLLVP